MRASDHHSPVRTIMFFVVDPPAAAAWYRDVVLGRGVVEEEADYWYLDVDGVEIGFHPADPDRNPAGGGAVVYFAVPSVDAAREKALAAGARHHRGPLEIEPLRAICQLVDPFGNVFGLDGPI